MPLPFDAQIDPKNADSTPQEGVNGFSLKQEPTALVDAALQVYARAGAYPHSRPLHEAAMAYRRELIRVVTEHRAQAAMLARVGGNL